MQPHPLSNISIATHNSTSNRTPEVNREVFHLNSDESTLQPAQHIFNIEQNAIINNIENNLHETR